jgi:polyisoprenoid-binding protein YceI
MTASTTEIPGYIAGTWTIDSTHSDVDFVVRHLGVSKVRGRFAEVEGEIVTGAGLADSKVSATIKAASIDTKNGDRDAHVKGADFLDVEQFPTLTFVSTGVRAEDGEYFIDGDLTVHGVTRAVTLEAEIGGFADGMAEGTKVFGISATTEIKRSDFGVGTSIPTAVLADKVKIELNIEAGLQA